MKFNKNQIRLIVNLLICCNRFFLFLLISWQNLELSRNEFQKRNLCFNLKIKKKKLWYFSLFFYSSFLLTVIKNLRFFLLLLRLREENITFSLWWIKIDWICTKIFLLFCFDLIKFITEFLFYVLIK